MSEASDSTNYLTSVTVDRYHNRPSTSMQRSITADGNNHHRNTRYNTQEFHRIPFTNSTTTSVDPQSNYRSSKMRRSVEWDEDNIQHNEGITHIILSFLERRSYYVQ